MRTGWNATRLHAVSGLVPTAAFLLLHPVQVFAAGTDRASWSARVWGLDGDAVWTALELLVVALPLVAHVALGLAVGRRPEPPGGRAFASPIARRWQRFSGLAAAAFVVAHVAHAWAPRLAGAPGEAVVDRLSVTLGQPAWLAAYAVGLTAVAVHFAGGVPAAARRLGWVRTASGARALRVVAGILAVALWGLSAQATARLATGEALP